MAKKNPTKTNNYKVGVSLTPSSNSHNSSISLSFPPYLSFSSLLSFSACFILLSLILLVFSVLVVALSLQDLNSPSRDRTCTLKWKHRVLTTGPPGKSPFGSLLMENKAILYAGFSSHTILFQIAIETSQTVIQ